MAGEFLTGTNFAFVLQCVQTHLPYKEVLDLSLIDKYASRLLIHIEMMVPGILLIGQPCPCHLNDALRRIRNIEQKYLGRSHHDQSLLIVYEYCLKCWMQIKFEKGLRINVLNL